MDGIKWKTQSGDRWFCAAASFLFFSGEAVRHLADGGRWPMWASVVPLGTKGWSVSGLAGPCAR